jgi:hypothetical protein
MLFRYTYVPHKIERMHSFIDFIFHEVWCKAPIGVAFHPNLFESNPDLQELMIEFGFSGKADGRGRAFYKSVKEIYELFAQLPALDIYQFKHWYQGNNDLEKVCANDPTAQIVRYADIAVAHKELSEQLAIFFKDLYSRSLLNLAAVRAAIGEIDDHFRAFVSTNKTGKCPFCGIGDLKGLHHSKLEAYDHYLPQGLYPFNSINFHNLAPACHECNSTYKLGKDPARGHAGRRKAFNPYASVGHAVQLQIALHHADIDKLGPADITLQFGPAAIAEEIDTWKDVYGIDERYKAKLSGENDGKYWLMQVLDEWKEDGRRPADFLASLARQSQSWPYADANFLRISFLNACKDVGMFDPAW